MSDYNHETCPQCGSERIYVVDTRRVYRCGTVQEWEGIGTPQETDRWYYSELCEQRWLRKKRAWEREGKQ